MQTLDHKTFYSKYADQYRAARDSGKLVNDFSEVEYMKHAVRGLQGNTQKKLLDVGCGYGKHLEYYQEIGYESYGIDPNTELLQQCAKTLRIQEASSEKIPFGDNSFDVITSSLVFFHIQDIRKTLREITRVLRDAGHLIITDINPEFTEKYGHKEKNTDVLSLLQEKESMKIYTRTRQQYKNIFIENGYRAIKTQLCYPNKGLEQIRERAFHILSETPAFILYHAQKQ